MALNCVIVAQKPWGKRRIDDIVRTGAGALNIDGGRIKADMSRAHYGGQQLSSIGYHGTVPMGYQTQEHSQGRWPANFALVHVPPDAQGKGGCERVGVRKVKGTNVSYDRGNVDQIQRLAVPPTERGHDPLNYCDPDGLETISDWRCAEGCPAAKLGEQSGIRKSGGHPHHPNKARDSDEYQNTCYGRSKAHLSRAIADSGTAARFFFQAGWEYEEMERTHTMTGRDMGKHEVICADVLGWAREYKGEKFHCILTDPSYALSKKKTLDMNAKIEDKIETVADLLEAYHSLQQWGDTGFMSKRWDTDTAFDPRTWRLLAEHLHPGGFVFAFASSRGWHRLACAMEDSGLIIQPSIFVWGTGVVEVPPMLGWLQGCLSEDTEILTENGWRSYHENLTGSRVMCYNVTTKELEYMPAQAVFIYDYQDTAYRIQSNSTDQIVTKNHRCPVERGGSFTFQRADALQSKEIVPILEGVQNLRENLSNCRLAALESRQWILLQGMWKNRNRTKPPSQESRTQKNWKDNILSYLRKRILHTSPNSTANEESNLFTPLCERTQIQIDARGGIKQESQRMGSQRTFGLDQGGSEAIYRKNQWTQQLELERRGNTFQEKGLLRPIQHQVREMSARICGNGSQGWLCCGTSSNCGSTSRAIPETIRSNTSQRPQSRKQRSYQPNDVQQQFGAQEIRSNWKARTTLAAVTPVFYSGKVWCVRVPTGAFVARRNGHIFITGNSSFPKATRIKGHPEFDGHRYGGQVLKDSLSPLVVAQKPWTNPRIDCIVRTGAGALWVDGGRITAGKLQTGGGSGKVGSCYGWSDTERDGGKWENTQGRWPSNFCLIHKKPEKCPICDGLGHHTWETWYARAKDHGGDREEWDSFSDKVDGKLTCGHCGGEGVVGGCRRVGVRRVRGQRPGSPQREKTSRGLPGGGYGQERSYMRPISPYVTKPGYADPDGMETVPDWHCAKDPETGEWLCPVAKLDEQAGKSKSEGGVNETTQSIGGHRAYHGGDNRGFFNYGDEGGRSRYFQQADWSHEIAERLATSDPVRYCPKAAKRERNQNLDDFYWRKDKSAAIGFVRITEEEWEALGEEEERIKEETGKRVSLRAQGNIHPTQKSISLCKWLATLLLPPKGYAPRRILIPFAGKMSEAIGAGLAGWEEIMAIEMHQDYCDAGEARMKWWSEMLEETGETDPKELLKKKKTGQKKLL